MDNLSYRYGQWVVCKRWYVIGASFLIVVISGMGLGRLFINADDSYFFFDDNPHLMYKESFDEMYTEDHNVLIVLSPKDGSVFTHDTLSAVEELTELSWDIPYTARVDSISNFQHTRADGDELIVESIIEDSPSLTDQQVNEIRKRTLAEPLLLNRFISSTGAVTAINIDIDKPSEVKNSEVEIINSVRLVLEHFSEKYPHIETRVTGAVMFDYTMMEASKTDITRPLMFVFLVLVLAIALRSVIGTISALIIVIISTTSAMGLAGWLSIPITAPSSTAAPIVLTLALAGSVHIMTMIIHHMRLGMSRENAITASLHENIGPIFITSITTLIGFLTLNSSDSPPICDLGNIVAIGVAMAFLFSVATLPALVSVLPLKVKTKVDQDNSPYLSQIAEFVIKRHRMVTFSCLSLFALSCFGVQKIKLDDNFLHYFDKRYEFRQAIDYVEENLTGLYRIEYSISAGKPDGINDPEYLKHVDEFVQWYKKQNRVIHVDSFSETQKSLNQNMHGGDKAFYQLPEQRDLAAQYLFLYEISLPDGLDLSTRINADKSALRVSVTLKDVTSVEVQKMDVLAQQWLKNNAPEAMFTTGTGGAILGSFISERNIKSMIFGTFCALILISFILILAFRSVKYGLLSLVPNLFPIIMAFGIWGVTMERIGFAASVLVALPMGILVDDTVHFIYKYLHARRRKNFSPEDSVRYAYTTVGKALWITSVSILGGFSVLAFSGFKPSSDMGIMTCITISLALALDLLLLPALLLLVDRKGGVKVPDQDGDVLLVTSAPLLKKAG